MTDTNEPQTERTDTNPKDTANFWQVQLGLADRDQQDWEKDGRLVVERYRAERKSAARRDTRSFNILYSNTETLKSALYGRAARPDVRRRFADRDPAAREAAAVLERALIYCAEAYDVDRCIEPALHDYLLPGRGVVRVEYEPVIKEIADPLTGMPVEVVADQIVRERYVYWEDYRQTPARTFDDVWWVAFRHVMSREDLRDNKFEKAAAIPLNWSPETGDKRPVPDDLKKAEVWEIWDKSRRKRLWIVKGYDKPLRIDDDPYGLEGFFPLPEPIVAVADTQTLVPRPEYFEYRDQAEDLDEIVGRISRLTRALKRRGVYDQAVKELKRLATAGDNQFIPVENWQALASKGGLQAAFQTEDISGIAAVLRELYQQRDMLVQGIYELTGIADIMRGATDPAETFGAQRLKAQFGSTRIRRRQRAVQKWIRDLYKLKAEIIAEHFEPQKLTEITGIAVSPEIVDAAALRQAARLSHRHRDRLDRVRGRGGAEGADRRGDDRGRQLHARSLAGGAGGAGALAACLRDARDGRAAIEARPRARGRDRAVEAGDPAEGRASQATAAATGAAAAGAAARSEGDGRAGEGGHHPGQPPPTLPRIAVEDGEVRRWGRSARRRCRCGSRSWP